MQNLKKTRFAVERRTLGKLENLRNSLKMKRGLRIRRLEVRILSGARLNSELILRSLYLCLGNFWKNSEQWSEHSQRRSPRLGRPIGGEPRLRRRHQETDEVSRGRSSIEARCKFRWCTHDVIMK